MTRYQKLREEKELSARQTAALIGMPEKLYLQMEQGDESLSIEYTVSFALLFHTSIDYLLERSEIRSPNLSTTKSAENETPHH